MQPSKRSLPLVILLRQTSVDYQATREYERSVQFDPKDVIAHTLLAERYYEAKNFVGACKHLEITEKLRKARQSTA
jgi:Tfp pilus assembly protein PilF